MSMAFSFPFHSNQHKQQVPPFLSLVKKPGTRQDKGDESRVGAPKFGLRDSLGHMTIKGNE